MGGDSAWIRSDAYAWTRQRRSQSDFSAAPGVSAASGWKVVPRLEHTPTPTPAMSGSDGGGDGSIGAVNDGGSCRITVVTGGLGSVGVLAAASRLRHGADSVTLLGRSGRARSVDIS